MHLRELVRSSHRNSAEGAERALVAMGLAAMAMAGFLVGAAFAAIVAPSHAVAHHSLLSPWWAQDCNNNGVIDDGCPAIERAGTNWNANRVARFSEAHAEWRNATDFDPVVGGSVRDAYVDRQPTCTSFNGAPAYTCSLGQMKATFIRVIDADIFMNPSIVWNSELGQNLSLWDFRGVITHEIGHTARLKDVYGADCGPTDDEYTMCGSGDRAMSWRLRTLESDDVNSVNTMYP